MNQRILELKIQACKWANKNVSSAEYENAADQKFAELIVQECAKISEECGINLNREDFRQGISRNIKQHFGVQE
jgi:hypothetical protein